MPIAQGLLLLLTSFSFAATKDKSSSLLDFHPMNTATIPGRCSADMIHGDPRIEYFKRAGEEIAKASDPDVGVIDFIFKDPGEIYPEVLLWKATDYYKRRDVVLKKMQDRAETTDNLEAYSRILLLMGEFQRIVEYFGPKKDLAQKNWFVSYALSQANFRLGHYPEAYRYAKRAHEKNPILDTRWQFMMSQLALYGKDFYQKFSIPGYTLKHVKKLFPNNDPSALPFEDVTEKMGLGPDRWAGYASVSFVDLDGDGYDDLVMERQFFPPKIYKNMGGKSFQAIPDEQMGNRNCNSVFLFAADYDNSGKPGFFRNCCNFQGGGGSVLLKNKGNLTFEDVTKQSGLDFQGDGVDFGWQDYDLDGNVDLAVADFAGTAKLYRNNGDGTFTDVTEKAGIKTPGSTKQADYGAMAVMWGDYDDDGWPDLFVQGWGWKKLYHNNGDGTFTDVTAKSGIKSDPGAKGYMGFFFDATNEGRLDLLAGQYVVGKDEIWGWSPICTCSNLLAPEGYSKREWEHGTVLYHNNGDGTFSVKQRFIPLGTMGFNHGDWDNDGHQDVILGAGGLSMQQAEPFLFFHNNGDGTFKNLTPFTMRGLWGKGHGIAFGDYAHEGHLDVMLNNGGALPGDAWPSMLLHNKGNKNHFLSIQLKPGAGTNGSAIGARVWVTAGKLLMRQDMTSGSGAFGGSSFALHFGLAKNLKADKIVIKWPNRKMDVTELKDVAADQAILVNEADGTYSQLWTPKKKS